MDKSFYDSLDYWSLKWFLPETFLSFTYAHSWVLYLMVLVPLAFAFRNLLFRKYRKRIEVAFFSENAFSIWDTYLRLIPSLLLALCLVLCIIALARPIKTRDLVEQKSEGVDIILAMDISESMKIEDFKPERLSAAKQTARKFLSGRVSDRIGLVVFAGEAYGLVPLTNDYDLLNQYLEDLDYGLIQKPGTAIGSAIAVATNRLRETKAKSKVVILISDGDNTAGNLDPKVAADLAQAYGIKIYTVLVGKEGLVPFGTDIFGNPQMVENTVDETTLRTITATTDAKFFRANSNKALSSIFKEIDRLEKTEVKTQKFQISNDYYSVYLFWGLVFYLLWLLSKATFLSNPLED